MKRKQIEAKLQKKMTKLTAEGVKMLLIDLEQKREWIKEAIQENLRTPVSNLKIEQMISDDLKDLQKKLKVVNVKIDYVKGNT